MPTLEGTRVGAILKADANTVYLLGWGTYDGDHEPPFGPFGSTKEEFAEMQREMGAQVRPWKNPRITLDDGRIVWGCQCWWGPEDQIKAKIAGRSIVICDLDGSPVPTPATPESK